MIQTFSPAGSPPPLGPYSPAVGAGGFVFCSGQVPRDAQGKMVADSIEAATTQALENVLAVLTAAGCKRSDVVKTTVFLKDLNDFDGMNKTYAAFFGSHRPARSTVQAARLPGDARVEVECIAVKAV